MCKSKLPHSPICAVTLSLLILGFAGCNKSNQATTPPQDNAAATQAADNNQDPAQEANLAPAVNTTQGAPEQTAGAPEQAPQYQAPQYQEQAPPPEDESGYDFNAPSPDQGEEAETYAPQPPPTLPEYDQPECP